MGYTVHVMFFNGNEIYQKSNFEIQYEEDDWSVKIALEDENGDERVLVLSRAEIQYIIMGVKTVC